MTAVYNAIGIEWDQRAYEAREMTLGGEEFPVNQAWRSLETIVLGNLSKEGIFGAN